MRLSTFIKGLAVLIAAAIATAVAILYSTDFNAYKGDIAALVRDATGRELVIEGDLAPEIGLVPGVAVEGVRFANASWGSRKDMARIEKFRAEVELLPLLFGDIRIRQIVLSGADILLESKADGTGNWIFAASGRASSAAKAPDAAATGAPSIPAVDKVLIENSVLAWRDGRSGETTTVGIDRLRGTADSVAAPVRLEFDGSYNGESVVLEGSLGSFTQVMSGAPLSVDLALEAGGARATVKGTVERPAEGKGVDLSLSVAGEKLLAMQGLAGAPLPAIGPYSLSASVADRGTAWQLKGMTLKVGQSDLGGNVAIDPSGKRPNVTADLTSSLFRVEDFTGAVASKADDRGSAASPAAGTGAAAGKGGRVFPDDPLPLDGLTGADGRVSLRARRIETEAGVLEDVSLDMTLRDGDLTVKPIQATYGGGRLAGELTLRNIRRTPRVAVELKMTGLDLGAIVGEAGHPGMIDGRLDAAATLSGSGKSVRSIMAGLDGTIETTMKGGRLDDRMLDVLSADVLNVLSPGESGDRSVRINCLVGRYDVKGGKVLSRATVFDTDRLLVAGEGGADLATEQIDFLVIPRAKQTSLAKLAVPLRIGGTFAAPTVFPDPAGVAKGALGLAAGIATGGVTTVLGEVLSRVSGDSKEDVCVAALKAGKVEPPSTSPVDDVQRTIKGIGDGLRNLFGR